MSLTKEDKQEISEMISIAIAEKLSNNASATQEGYPDTSDWREKGIESKLTGLTIAPEDFYIIQPDGTKKTHFTYDEAIEAAKSLPDGWRLPTRSEWCLICEEFANDPETGELSETRLMEALGLGLNGWRDSDGDLYSAGRFGSYWSCTAYSADYARGLNFRSSSVGPANNNRRGDGYSVRCVAL